MTNSITDSVAASVGSDMAMAGLVSTAFITASAVLAVAQLAIFAVRLENERNSKYYGLVSVSLNYSLCAQGSYISNYDQGGPLPGILYCMDWDTSAFPYGKCQMCKYVSL